MPTFELREQLVSLRTRIDAAEARWLAMVAEFDLREAWSADGALSMVDWLVTTCGFGRRAAKERVRVAHALRRRPLVAEQFAAGTLSYSKVRAITRISDADTALDEALLELAKTGTAADLEAAAGHWEKIRDQDDPVAAAQAQWERRGLRRHRGYDGLDRVEIVAPPEDVDRLLAVVDAYAERLRARAVDKGSAEPSTALLAWTHRRVDALVDLVEEGLAHAAADGDVNVERTLVSVGVDYQTLIERAPGGALLGAGAPLTGEAARRLACDAGLVRVITRGRSEILDVGRKTRQWPTAIRRAIMFRHGNHCCFPGCGRRIVQIHHVRDWTKGGETSVDAGVPACAGHHRLVHELGWTVRYDMLTGVVTFTSPDGQVIATAPIYGVAA
jgi:hypothetical protein